MATSAAEVLRERYPEMFKPSHNCRPPHLNVDVLREHMHKAELISRLKVGDADVQFALFDTYLGASGIDAVSPSMKDDVLSHL